MDGSFQIVKERKAKRSRLETKIVQLTPFVFSCLKERCGGGADRDRTGDPLLAKQVLSQLSYSPLLVSASVESQRRLSDRGAVAARSWWVWEDSNFRPHPYQGCALTT
jgi:hypothetical protein